MEKKIDGMEGHFIVCGGGRTARYVIEELKNTRRDFVVIEKDRARNGRSIEVVGTYNPRTSPASVDLKHERIAYWRSVGAQFSPIVAKLVEKNPAKAAAAEPAVA